MYASPTLTLMNLHALGEPPSAPNDDGRCLVECEVSTMKNVRIDQRVKPGKNRRGFLQGLALESMVGFINIFGDNFANSYHFT